MAVRFGEKQAHALVSHALSLVLRSHAKPQNNPPVASAPVVHNLVLQVLVTMRKLRRFGEQLLDASMQFPHLRL